jgi:predicted secreted protein
MSIITFIFVYILVWWVVIFMVLPWGNKATETPEIGHATGTPINPRIKIKLIWTSIIALIITGIVFALSQYTDFFTLRDGFKAWQDTSF